MAATLSQREIRRILELTHELSTTVGGVMDHLVLTATRDLSPSEVMDRVMACTQLSMRSTTTLQKLMWELGLIAQRADVVLACRPPEKTGAD